MSHGNAEYVSSQGMVHGVTAFKQEFTDSKQGKERVLPHLNIHNSLEEYFFYQRVML